MAVDACSGFKNALPSRYWRASCSRMRELLLLMNPAVEVRASLHIDAEQHKGVLRPAVLRALPEVQSRLHADRSTCYSGDSGSRSVLPASRGTQKLWSVSAESSVMNVGVGCAGSLTGTCSSLAVTMFNSG